MSLVDSLVSLSSHWSVQSHTQRISTACMDASVAWRPKGREEEGSLCQCDRESCNSRTHTKTTRAIERKSMTSSLTRAGHDVFCMPFTAASDTSDSERQGREMRLQVVTNDLPLSPCSVCPPRVQA